MREPSFFFKVKPSPDSGLVITKSIHFTLYTGQAFMGVFSVLDRAKMEGLGEEKIYPGQRRRSLSGDLDPN